MRVTVPARLVAGVNDFRPLIGKDKKPAPGGIAFSFDAFRAVADSRFPRSGHPEEEHYLRAWKETVGPTAPRGAVESDMLPHHGLGGSAARAVALLSLENALSDFPLSPEDIRKLVMDRYAETGSTGELVSGRSFGAASAAMTYGGCVLLDGEGRVARTVMVPEDVALLAYLPLAGFLGKRDQGTFIDEDLAELEPQWEERESVLADGKTKLFRKALAAERFDDLREVLGEYVDLHLPWYARLYRGRYVDQIREAADRCGTWVARSASGPLCFMLTKDPSGCSRRLSGVAERIWTGRATAMVTDKE